MRKLFVTLVTSLLACSAASAFWPEAADSSFEIGVGYRHDTYKSRTRLFSSDFVNGTGEPVQLENQFKLKNLRIWEIEAKGKYVTCDNIYIRARADYGWMCEGHNSYCDSLEVVEGTGTYGNTIASFPLVNGGSGYYSGPGFFNANRRLKGNVYDFNIALGYQFKLCDDSFAITPVVGWSAHSQHFKLKHRSDCDSDYYYDDYTYNDYYYYDYYSYGSGSGGESGHRFRTHWTGPFLGLDFDYRIGCDWSLNFAYEYHWAHYHSDGPGAISPFIDGRFKQRSRRAYGNVLRVGTNYDFCDSWTIGLNGEFMWWQAKHGRTRIKTLETSADDVDFNCFISFPLRRVRWDSYAVTVDVGMLF